MERWGATEAKAKFSAVLDKAETEGPQLVQRRKKTFVLLTEEELEERTKSKGMVAMKAPAQSAWDALRPSAELRFDYEFPRVRGKVRQAKF